MSDCLSPTDFEEYHRGLCDEVRRLQLQTHLRECDRCAAEYKELQDDQSFLHGAAKAIKSAMSGDRTASQIQPHRSKSTEHLPRIEGYKIEGILGRGGMGVVYEAVQEKLKRRVALKLLPAVAGAANPNLITRFQREAAAAASLHHTNIIPIYDFGESRDGYYYAMELIRGQTIGDMIKRLSAANAPELTASSLAALVTKSPDAPGPTLGGEVDAQADSGSTPSSVSSTTGKGRAYYRQVAQWMADVANALHFAHVSGIIHRDVKPANLILSTDGRLMVADFGLAKSAGDDSVTVSGSLIGTYRYMSPEQVGAKRVRIDARTDIYSLGATLYELLALQPAFTASNREELLGQILFRDPTPPRKIVPTVPAELQTICLCAMEKNPDVRYSTARDLADDLRRFIGDRPIVARQPGPISRVTKFIRRHKAQSVAGIAGWALMVVIALWVRSATLAKIESERLTKIQNNKAEVKGLLDLAKEDFHAQRWRKAERSARKAITILPDDLSTQLALARINKELYNNVSDARTPEVLREAELLCRKVLAKDPDNSLALNLHGVVLKKLGQYDAAVDAYQKVIQLKPSSYAAWVNLGTIQALQHELERALSSLSKSVQLADIQSPYCVYTWRSLAALQFHLGAGEAYLNAREAVRCKSDDVASWVLSARIGLAAGKVDLRQTLDDAKYADTTATTSGRPDAKAKRILALAYLLSEQFDKAATQANQAIELGDQPAINHLIMANALAALGDAEEARKHLTEADITWPAELKDDDAYLVTADAGVLWFDAAKQWRQLRTDAQARLETVAAPR